MERNSIKAEEIKLPEGYDIINDYQENTEQAVVDNLFDYFGRVYYKNYGNTEVKKVRNHYISKHDLNLFRLLNKKIIKFGVAAAVLIILAIIGYVLFYFLAGATFADVFNLAATNAGVNGWSEDAWRALFIVIFTIICLVLFAGLICLGFAIYWLCIRGIESKRIHAKIDDWNAVFGSFCHNLSKSGIHNAIQSAIPTLVFDKHTPTYDRKTYNLHSRIYSFADIPRDAKKIDFKNLISGFYKGSPFSISYSAWEWFREAKVVNEKTNNDGHKVFVNVKRSLRRFEDQICVLTVDSFAENKLNFVLNNPDGKNLRLQNKIFNNVFSLAVNNPKLAYTVFTPYVQHTLARCKTWCDAARSIRQVIKEGSKIYVVFDGKSDFFKFDRIVDPKLNYVFNTRDTYTNVVINNDSRIQSKQKLFAIGSLDETASLMTEYILEELDILFTALEMATCYPLDNSIIAKQKSKQTLYDVLEKKQNENINLKYRNISDLNDRLIYDVPVANIDLSQPWQPKFEGERISLKEDKSFLDN